jgi:hypothetical protein
VKLMHNFAISIRGKVEKRKSGNNKLSFLNDKQTFTVYFDTLTYVLKNIEILCANIVNQFSCRN